MINNGVVLERHTLDNEKLKAQSYYSLIPVGSKACESLSAKNRKYTYLTIMHIRV